jgi:hypothetical protein
MNSNAIFRIETSVLMFKYNFHNWNYNFRLQHIFLNTTNNVKNSYFKLQIEITIFGIQIIVFKFRI